MINTLIIKTTGDCNLNCTYCYYKNNQYDFKGMRLSVHNLESIFNKYNKYLVEKNVSNIQIVFHGGEPMLNGIQYFQDVLKLQRKIFSQSISISNSLQTNGTLINKKWVNFFKKENIKLGISLDGPKDVHDLCRRFSKNQRGSYSKVINSIKLLNDANIKYGVLTVLNPNVSGRKVFEHHYSVGVRSMDFLLPILSSKFNDCDLVAYFNYMKEVYDSWIELDDPDVKIRNFEEIIQLLYKGSPSLCSFSNNCIKYLTIEPNGNIGMCENLRMIQDENFSYLLEESIHSEYDFNHVEDKLIKIKELYKINDYSNECEDCNIFTICKGGCLLNRYRINDFGNTSMHCLYYKSIIDYVVKSILKNR